MFNLSLKVLLGVFGLMFSASVGLSAETRSCSFQLNGKIIFDEVCDTGNTENEENRIIIASEKYFVYALLYDDTWDVFWNEEPYASHAHTRLGDAKLVSDLCLKGENFLACITEGAVGCNDDPNECTPKNLCEIATQVSNHDKVWSEDPSAAKHIAFVKELGMDCGVVEITDPCDLDPNECKVKQLCEKATTGDDGSKSWNTKAEGYVELAKEYGLECGVEEIVSQDGTCDWRDFGNCTDKELCEEATETFVSGPTYWDEYGHKIYVKEAKRRGLSCGVKEVAEKLSNTFATWSDYALCKFMTPSNNYTSSDDRKLAIAEVKRRGLDCGVEDTSGVSKSSKETLATYFKKQSLTKRKQIQYALKSRSYYHKTIDGLWGAGTRKAINDFLFFHNDMKDQPVKYIYAAILNLVGDLPTTFDTPKNSYSSSSSSGNNSSSGKNGWVPISGNPKLSFDDASEICEAKAIAEGNSYINNNQPRDRRSSIDCDSYGFNSFSCSRSRGGGASTGILRYLDNAENYNAGKKLAQAVARACMADYGWVKR